MLDGYISEKEQIESIRKWWRENGTFLLIAICVGLSIGFGWHYFHRYEARRLEQASMIYQSVLQADAQNKISTAQGGAVILMKDFSGSPYASLGALLFAKESVVQNNFSIALEKLQWVIDHGNVNSLRQIARIYAARILLSQGKTADALTQLSVMNDQQFLPVVNWVKGDIYTKTGDVKKAKIYYQNAKTALVDFPPAQALLTQQLAN